MVKNSNDSVHNDRFGTFRFVTFSTGKLDMVACGGFDHSGTEKVKNEIRILIRFKIYEIVKLSEISQLCFK